MLSGWRSRALDVAYGAYVAVRRRQASSERPEAPDGLPLPPPKLRTAVAGTPDARWFLESGQRAADSIRAALAAQDVAVESLASMLDFGCGCGRVTRYWSALDGVAVSGTDRNPRLVRWCSKHLPFARFQVNQLEPPLAFGDMSFEFVYALSVFTHLPLDSQHRWIAELHRVLRPGGYLLVTTHGAAYRPQLNENERRAFDEGEVVVRRPSLAGTNLCATFHPETYIRTKLAPQFDLVHFEPEGATGNPHQDLVLLRRGRR